MLYRLRTGPEQETRRGTERLERPYQRPEQVPREVSASRRQGGDRPHRGNASAYTHNGHAEKSL